MNSAAANLCWRRVEAPSCPFLRRKLRPAVPSWPWGHPFPGTLANGPQTRARAVALRSCRERLRSHAFYGLGRLQRSEGTCRVSRGVQETMLVFVWRCSFPDAALPLITHRIATGLRTRCAFQPSCCRDLGCVQRVALSTCRTRGRMWPARLGQLGSRHAFGVDSSVAKAPNREPGTSLRWISLALAAPASPPTSEPERIIAHLRAPNR